MIPDRRMATQQDVARLAGVSTATVSRVLNNRKVTTSVIRKRVQAAMETLNYIPHAGARALATRRSGLLGAIVPTLHDATFAEGINAFERTAQRLGYALNLSVSERDPQHEHTLVQQMIERGVDGLLLVGNLRDPAVYQQLTEANIRHVCTWTYNTGAPAPNVGFDNVQAMHAVVDHLVELGHQRFGMLAGELSDNDRARDRVHGVRQRLAHHGLSLPAANLVQVPYSLSAARQGFWEVIDENISALVCGSDVLAFGALLEAQKTGLRVPEELSITGFGDLPLAAELTPALTSVQVAAEALGSSAARRLIAAVEHSAKVVSAPLQTRLVPRASTGACVD